MEINKVSALTNNSKALAARIMWLAYQASQVVGMGRFQARDDVTEGEFLDAYRDEGSEMLSADYAFGRMVKLTIYRDSKNAKELYLEGYDLRPDYQSWATTYPTRQDLMDAAQLSLQLERCGGDSSQPSSEVQPSPSLAVSKPFWKQTHGGMAIVFEHGIYELSLFGKRATVNQGIGDMTPEQTIDNIKLEAQRAVEDHEAEQAMEEA